MNVAFNSAHAPDNQISLTELQEFNAGILSDLLDAAAPNRLFDIQASGTLFLELSVATVEAGNSTTDPAQQKFSIQITSDNVFDPANLEASLDFENFSSDLTVTIHDDTTVSITNGVFEINHLRNVKNIVGGSGSDTLIGPDVDSTWNITGFDTLLIDVFRK